MIKVIAFLLIGSLSFGQINGATQLTEGPITQDRMQQLTLEALAKFYGIDIVFNEASRRAQEKYLPEEAKPFIPYFLVLHEITVNQRFVFRSTF